MSNVYGKKSHTTEEIIARVCDVCGFEERSNRAAIRFDHDSDSKWAKIRLQLEDYTNPNDIKTLYACSFECLAKLMEQLSQEYTQEGDCFNSIPMNYIKAIIELINKKETK